VSLLLLRGIACANLERAAEVLVGDLQVLPPGDMAAVADPLVDDVAGEHFWQLGLA